MNSKDQPKRPARPAAPPVGRRKPAWLALEDGSVFEGLSFGAEGDAEGECVFNTSMTGYQEVLTDPSYKGQMVVMTVANVGNYGINPEDGESDRAHVAGFVVREACAEPSNWRSREALPAYLRRHGIAGIEGVDSRALTALLRTKGALRGVISTRESKRAALVTRARAVPPIEERDLVQEVTCSKPYPWNEPVSVPGTRDLHGGQTQIEFGTNGAAGGPFHVAVVDCGVKRNILRSLVSQGCRVTVVPAFSTAGEILSHHPDGVVFSNGPGDPERLPKIVEAVRGCIRRVPVFGICLGHQVIGRALGGRTFKLKFGHHGGNHPVRHTTTGKVAITVQNHNFAVEASSLPSEAEISHLNLNDGTVEGLRHRNLPVFSVQYHPEAAPGPHDAVPHFKEFVRMMAADRGHRKNT